MKKILFLLLAGMLLVSFTSCKNKGTGSYAGPATEIDTASPEKISYYQNPLLTSDTEEAWNGYGFGDPFVMRFNGTYYLYVSTKDNNTGIKCWSSDDLVHWTYRGLCSEERITRTAYAPEVVYYNGMFYMYTSPGGNGHYVLASDSPTGPFEAVTGNMGMSIDGSVFIDNDGQWYFYTSGGGAINAYKMNSPMSMTHIGELDNVSMNGWTEGPMVVYHDGFYYMTYTGNHVLCKAYRINYAVSDSSPVSYSQGNNNPLLVNTSDDIYGIGHSSTVKGPDLDSYYIVYHSLVNTVPNRSTNIDRIFFNGTDMKILGPDTYEQQAPSLPDVYSYFREGYTLEGWTLYGSQDDSSSLTLSAGSILVSDYRFSGNYTAEYNVLSISDGGKAGALFSYTDEDNYGSFEFDPAGQKAIITFMTEGNETVMEQQLVTSFNEEVRFDCVQSIQIEKNNDKYTFYVNDRELCSFENVLKSGGIGYLTDGASASFGFIGGTGAVGGQGAADEYKTVSDMTGTIPADNYTTGSFESVTKDGISAVTAEKGYVLNYRINVAETGSYDLAVRYFTEKAGRSAEIEIYSDGGLVGTVLLNGSSDYATKILRKIPLDQGQRTFSVKVTSGSAAFVEFTLLKGEEAEEVSIDFSGEDDGTVYSDGAWSIEDGILNMAGNPSTGKRLYGNANWGDYIVEADVTPRSNINCGLLVRVTSPGAPNFQNNEPTDNDANGGTDWLKGYFVGITDSGVILGRQNYGYKTLAEKQGNFKRGVTYHLMAVCEGASIRVYVDDELYIEYTDNDPYIQGMAGVRSHQGRASFDNFKISKISN